MPGSEGLIKDSEDAVKVRGGGLLLLRMPLLQVPPLPPLRSGEHRCCRR